MSGQVNPIVVRRNGEVLGRVHKVTPPGKGWLAEDQHARALGLFATRYEAVSRVEASCPHVDP